MFGCRSLWLVLLVPVLAGAQEPSGLEKAKQDLKSLPTARKDSERPELRLPEIAAPSPVTDQPAAPGPALRPGVSAAEAKTADRTSNWLVDAMMKGDARPGDAGRKDKRTRDEGHSLDPDAADSDRDPDRRPASGKGPLIATRESEAALAAGNPLTPFMADWISKRDHALLLPKDSPSLGLGTDTPFSAGGPQQPVVITFQGIDGRLEAPAGPAARQPAENPFLQALQTPAIPPPVAAPSPLPALPDGRNPALRPSESARETRPAPPIDLSKPSQDSKYFPQLKRF